MINLTANIAEYRFPFPYFRGTGLVDQGDLEALDSSAPAAERFEHLDRSAGDVRRRYSLSVLPLLDEATGLKPDLATFAEPWRQLVTELLSEEVTRWLGAVTGVNTIGLRRNSSIFRHQDGDFQGLSTGKLDKRLQFSLHLNPNWPEDGDGCSELYAGSDQTPGPHTRLLPIGGSAILYTPTPSSWHRMAPVDPNRGLLRQWITLAFFR
ncbi:hypothetical protein [Pseudonocardia phyllosphaerae]|uniref:hypothetical protein n=1 Tax=Pseudonocardia phyllosphaerae TaxID=3390502 RepID=UPI003979644C